jgi:hypothetical protein
VKLTQFPLHSVWPLGHVVVHVPPMQAIPLMQACPQVPQFWLSVWTLVQVPLHSCFPPVHWFPPSPPPPASGPGTGLPQVQLFKAMASAIRAPTLNVFRKVIDIPS